jgi:hypothetical protein
VRAILLNGADVSAQVYVDGDLEHSFGLSVSGNSIVFSCYMHMGGHCGSRVRPVSALMFSNHALQRFGVAGSHGERFAGGKGLASRQTESAGADEPTVPQPSSTLRSAATGFWTRCGRLKTMQIES